MQGKLLPAERSAHAQDQRQGEQYAQRQGEHCSMGKRQGEHDHEQSNFYHLSRLVFHLSERSNHDSGIYRRRKNGF